MNAYFTCSVVGWRGTATVSYEAAVTAIMIEVIIFLLLAVTGVRYAIIKLIPEPVKTHVKTATPAAIGAFLAHLGLAGDRRGDWCRSHHLTRPFFSQSSTVL
jgi:AGZA family xanthine/uracil permease-like MFS transporter